MTATGNDTPLRHPVTVELDALTEAIISLVRHEAACAECDRLLPDAECDERARLKRVWSRAAWRRSLREDARRIASSAAMRE